MATMSIDELNSFEPEKYIEDYFKPMPISEDRKEERRDAAKDFRDILLLILALIAIEYEKNLLDWAYIQEQFRKELLSVSLKYAAESEAIQDYVNTKSNDFIDTTKEQDLSDPYWTSDMRATHEAVNEANDVISISEMQRAEELGAVQKRWKTERDTKVRPTHRAVDGAVENIDDMFRVGKDLMRFPHDWYYSAKESYNCRCGLDYLDENGKVVLVGKMKEEVNKNYNKYEGYTEEQIAEIKAIEGTPFKVRKALGAMAARFYVDTPKRIKDTPLYIKPGSYVEGVKVIAAGTKIKDLKRLIETYKLQNGALTKPKDWYKVRGRAILTDGEGKEATREIHWYQAKNIGKVEFKLPSNPKQV